MKRLRELQNIMALFLCYFLKIIIIIIIIVNNNNNNNNMTIYGFYVHIFS